MRQNPAVPFFPIIMNPESIQNRLNDFKRSYTRRKRNHDYKGNYTYHIILKKAPGCPNYGSVSGDSSFAPGQPGSATILHTNLGKAIQKEIFNFDKRYPFFQIYQFKVMPDHVHILIKVKERLEKHLGYYIGRLKFHICERYASVEPSFLREMAESPTSKIFQSNYTDKIIYTFRSLKELITYIRENPHRLAMRKQYPEFFSRVRKIDLCGVECELYGNLFLLRNPDKYPGIIHRRYNKEEQEHVIRQSVYTAIERGVVVSTFVHPLEQEIRELCIEEGGYLIHFVHEEFGEIYKPSGREFRLCSEGKLLQISIKTPKGTQFSHPLARKMNAIIKALCE